MGGMDNDTSIGLAKARYKARLFHVKESENLYNEYIESGAQYSKTFVEWKQERRERLSNKKRKRKRKKERMQRPLTKKQLEERCYNSKLSLNYIRWK